MRRGPEREGFRWQGPAAYLALLAVAVGGFLLVRERGRLLVAPEGAAAGAPSAVIAHGGDMLLHVLVALAGIIVIARLFGALFRRIHQPAVIGEMLAGILLGPSFLGRVAPAANAFLFPPAMVPILGTVSQIGVLVYLFLIGIDLDTVTLRRRGSSAVAISHASIVAPFLLGSTLALVIYPITSTRNVDFTVFALFMGVAMSITAFPVLARILSDRGLTRTRVGIIAITAAAADDVTAWCLLAVVVGIAQSQLAGAALTFALALAYLALLFVFVAPQLRRFSARIDRQGEMRQGQVALLLVGVLASSLITEAIGIHALFGAFVFGALIPHDGVAARELRRRLEDLVAVLLLPVFFAFTGLRTRVDLVAGAGSWLLVVVIILVASVGKLGGGLLAARVTGIGWRDAIAIGVLMNTRGLMELIVLNIGLDLGVISPLLFAMMVVMALVTTFATTPILALLRVHDPAPVAVSDLGRTAAAGP